jgi:hypothetical protein
MKLAVVMLVAQTVLPKTRPACRSQSVSNTNDARPETKKSA